MKELSYYDGRLIRLTDASGAVYEGICAHNSADYNEHEFGVYEEGVEIFHFLFYKSDIKQIEEISEFSAPYGLIEKLTAEDKNLLEQALEFDENEIHMKRLINYINSK